MNIFFTASIRGGRENLPAFERIVRVLERYGTVHAPHIADASVSEYGETDTPDAEILTRELAALVACDIVVAEVTTPSLGVGYFIARATDAGKKVLALYRGQNTLKLSAPIKGDPRVSVHLYKDENEIEGVLKTAFSA
ncbi:MAG: nucleoside 2-deoxyribosyltransferase [Patescibacteria group bacterium]